MGLATGGWESRGLFENPRDEKPTLASQGIDKNLAFEGVQSVSSAVFHTCLPLMWIRSQDETAEAVAVGAGERWFRPGALGCARAREECGETILPLLKELVSWFQTKVFGWFHDGFALFINGFTMVSFFGFAMVSRWFQRGSETMVFGFAFRYVIT